MADSFHKFSKLHSIHLLPSIATISGIMFHWTTTFLLTLLVTPGSQALVVPSTFGNHRHSTRSSFVTVLAANGKKATSEDETVVKQSTRMDPAVRSKLLAESIAPWRAVRLFLYGSLGSGAAVGGFITLAGTLAALSGARSDLDLNTQVCYITSYCAGRIVLILL